MLGRVDVLIVDDDLDMVDSLRDVLTDRGFEVAIARDGQEALEYLAAAPAPSVILLDWMMPRCDGATFRERQLANPAFAGIPVVILTADARVEERRDAMDSAPVLLKPVEITDLVGVLSKITSAAE